MMDLTDSITKHKRDIIKKLHIWIHSYFDSSKTPLYPSQQYTFPRELAWNDVLYNLPVSV